MGRGKSWSREESEAVAKAWKLAANEIPNTREQNTKNFASLLYQSFVKFAPTSDDQTLNGRWKSRSQMAVKTQFDAIGDDILRFNHHYYNIALKASDCGFNPEEDNVLCAAIGVHLGAINLNMINFNHIDTVVLDWKLFEAWCILKSCPKFMPHQSNSYHIKSHAKSHANYNSNHKHENSEESLPPPPPPPPPPPRRPSRIITSASGAIIALGGHTGALQEASLRRSLGTPAACPNKNTGKIEQATPSRLTTRGSGASNGASSTGGGRPHPASGNTPMKTLASAALSMPALSTPRKSSMDVTITNRRHTADGTYKDNHSSNGDDDKVNGNLEGDDEESDGNGNDDVDCSVPSSKRVRTRSLEMMTGTGTTIAGNVEGKRPLKKGRLQHPSHQAESDHNDDDVDHHTELGGFQNNHAHCQGSTSSHRHHVVNEQHEDDTNDRPRLRHHNSHRQHMNSNGRRKKHARTSSATAGSAAPSEGEGAGGTVEKVDAGSLLNVSTGSIQLIGHAIRSLGDALSEYNAIMLFSRPDMQERQDQKLFFDALAKKHVLKAQMDRDELAREMQRMKEKTDEKNKTTND